MSAPCMTASLHGSLEGWLVAHVLATATVLCWVAGEQGGGTSLFLEPMSWMASMVVGEVQGKLYCPDCNARLGSFNWSGAQGVCKACASG